MVDNLVPVPTDLKDEQVLKRFLSSLHDKVSKLNNFIPKEGYESGTVIQVVNYLSKSRFYQVTNTTDQQVHDMALSITPKADNSYFKISIRWGGEMDRAWEHMFNIKRDGTKINLPLPIGTGYDWSVGLGSATQSYGAALNNDSTLEFMNFSTIDKTGSVKGVSINFQLVASAITARGFWSNGTFAGAADGQSNYERCSSEIIIEEIAQ